MGVHCAVGSRPLEPGKKLCAPLRPLERTEHNARQRVFRWNELSMCDCIDQGLSFPTWDPRYPSTAQRRQRELGL